VKKQEKQERDNKCAKCGYEKDISQHHILPKALYDSKLKIPLCCNCHKDLHRFIGHKYNYKVNKQPKEFYYKKFAKWFFALGFILIIMLYMLL